MTQTPAAFWDRRAQRYAAQPIKDETAYARTLEITRHYLKPSDRVLEIGAGTGSTAVRLAPHVSRITATDVSGEMMAIARDRAWNAASGNVTVRQASTRDALAENGDETWTVILAFNILHLLPDLETRLGEIRAALPEGGHFISKTPCLSEMNLAIRAIVPVMRVLGLAPFVRFLTGDALEAMIREAGFEIVESVAPGAPSSRMVVARAV